MNRNATVKVAVLLVVIVAIALGFSQQSPADTEATRPDYEILFTIPVGEAGIHYAGVGPESRPWGPSSFRVAADGTFWIADTAANRLVQFDRSGTLLSVLDMPADVVAITDFGIDGGTFVVLDASSVEPSVYKISTAGVVLDRWRLPSGIETPTGIRIAEAGVLLEQEGGAIVSRLADGGSDTVALEKAGDVDELAVSSLKNSFSLRNGRKQRTERVHNTLARATVLDSPTQRIVPIFVEEMVSLPTIHVDQTVWLYDASLQPLGRVRVPLAEQYVYIEHPVVVGHDGEIYALLTFPDYASVAKLTPSRTLRPILPSPPVMQATEFLGSRSKTCVERSTILSRASAYLNNRQTLSTTNISGTCSGRKKPNYLSSAGSYYSVPYDWGGNDTVSQFNSYMMNSSYKAGDIDFAASESCSRGVDCSGFVGRVWGKSTKYSTSTLSNISARLSSTAVLKQGDVVNRAGDHVALFARATSSGAYWYESTMFNYYDRVIYEHHPWSYFSGYTPRRFLEVCGGQSE